MRESPPPLNWHAYDCGRVAIFRPCGLGAALCMAPALRALREALPDARISWIGLPWARELAQRWPEIDSFVEFPGFPGIPPVIADIEALPAFLQSVQREAFDLLLQWHGAGRVANPLMATFGARRIAGFLTPDEFCADPELHIEWPRQGHEIERLLRSTDHLGFERRDPKLSFPINDTDRVELASIWPLAYGTQRVAVIHPGASLPSRRWTVEGFAAVADSLADQGCAVVLVGAGYEADTVARVQAAMRTGGAVDLAGRTSLWTLGAVVERASIVVCNDAGISQIAEALDRSSVVVSIGDEASRWAPKNSERHPVVWASQLRDIAVDDVCAAAHSLLEHEILDELEAKVSEHAALTGPSDWITEPGVLMPSTAVR